MSRVLAFNDFGGPEQQQLHDLAVPEPGPGEIAIEVKAAGVNPVDWKIREGLLGKHGPLPIPMGREASGVVVAALDDWSSEGAQKYKKAAINQNNALSEFRQLCFDNSAACEQVAQVNASIFNATYDSLETVASQIDTSPAVTGEDYYGRSYYVRSDSAAAKLEGLKTWMDKIVTTNGDWGSTAYDISTAIDEVRSSPANLGFGGTWPEAKAAPETASSTGDMTSNTQGDIDGAEGTGTGEGTLDK